MQNVFKPKEYYTQDVIKQIHLYTMDKSGEGARVIGSLSYRTGNASDTDLFEQVFRKDKHSLVKLFTSQIKRIVETLNKDKDQYFLEVKLGLDRQFSNIKIGSCANDNFLPTAELFTVMYDHYLNKMVPVEEIQTIFDIGKKTHRNQIDYEIVKEIIRKHAVLRWNASEIAKGYKMLHGTKYTIEEAICEKSQTNIEGIFIDDNNKYVECSNFFALIYEDAEGNKHSLNLSDDTLYDTVNERKENLKQSMYTLMYSKLHPNFFKVLKRMMSYSRVYGTPELLEKIYPILNSNFGTLYALNSQLKTIMKLLKERGSKYLYKETLYHTLDTLRNKLYELINVEFDFKHLNEIIDITISSSDVIKESQLLKELTAITSEINDYLNDYCSHKMANVGLYPLPINLIPKNKPF